MSLMCNRIASSTSRCCIVLAKKQSTVSAPKSNLNTADRTFYRRDFAWNEKRSLKSFCRSLAPSRAFDDDVDYLRCWNCNADFSHCVHSMVILKDLSIIIPNFIRIWFFIENVIWDVFALLSYLGQNYTLAAKCLNINSFYYLNSRKNFLFRYFNDNYIHSMVIASIQC